MYEKVRMVNGVTSDKGRKLELERKETKQKNKQTVKWAEQEGREKKQQHQQQQQVELSIGE